MTKLYTARSNLESRVERLVSKLKDVFFKLVLKNEELFDLASETENPGSLYPVLMQWLDDVFKNNEKFLLEDRSYFDFVDDRDTVCEGVNTQVQANRSLRPTASTMSSQLKHDFLMAKLKREEAEIYEKVAMYLAIQKHKNAMR